MYREYCVIRAFKYIPFSIIAWEVIDSETWYLESKQAKKVSVLPSHDRVIHNHKKNNFRFEPTKKKRISNLSTA